MNPFSLRPGSTYIIKPVDTSRPLFFTTDEHMPAVFIKTITELGGRQFLRFRFKSGTTGDFLLEPTGKLFFSINCEVKLISTDEFVNDTKLDQLNRVKNAMKRSGFGGPAVQLSSSSYGSQTESFEKEGEKRRVQNELQNQQKRRLRRYYNFNIIYRDPHRNIYEVKFSRLREPLYSDLPTQAFFILPIGGEISLKLKDGKFRDENDERVEVIGNLTFEEYEMQQMQSEEEGSLRLRAQRRDQEGMNVEDKRSSDRRKIDRYKERFQQMQSESADRVSQMREQYGMKNEDVRIPSGGKSRRKRKCRKTKSRRRKLKGR